MKKIGIYIHIPFCRRKCSYCDFYSVSWNQEIEKKYLSSLINEIRSYADKKLWADTIYIGGGTPTIVKPENIEMIIGEVKEAFFVDENSEISMEANPNTLTSENLSVYKKSGINRLSIGIQSLNDDILIKLGRLHNSNEALKAICNAKMQGFDNINADVMFNIPGQSVRDVIDTIVKIEQYDIKHISFYSLTLEKGTPLCTLEEEHKIIMPCEDEERNMYYEGRNIMEKHGLMQYEISNFAKTGFECRHNLKYWKQEEYVGLGPAAHSFMDKIRFSNPSDINLYCNNSNNYNYIINEKLDKGSMSFENIMLNLRLTKGMKISEYNQKFNLKFNEKYMEQIEFLIRNGLIVIENDYVRLTMRGMDMSNYVFSKFM